GQDEDRRRQVGVERLVLGADGEVAEQADDRQPVDVVVERTQRLGQEERQETSLPQQVELRMMVGRHASPGVWREPSKPDAVSRAGALGHFLLPQAEKMPEGQMRA